MVGEFITGLQAFGMVDIILWMLTFAIVYGVLSQVGEGGIPKHKGSRGIIGMVVAFLVILSPASAMLSEMISKISSSLLLVVLGLLTLIVFIEAAGITTHVQIGRHPETGKKIYHPEAEESIFSAYGRYFAVALLFITIMIFVGAGGLKLIGLGNIGGFENVNILGAGLFVMIILAIIWMIAESGEEKKK